MKKKLESIRTEYNSQSINYNNLFSDPIDQLKLWMNEAIDSKIKDPNAVVLSTYDNVKGIQSRVVLIKDINEFGLILYPDLLSPILNQDNLQLEKYYQADKLHPNADGVLLIVDGLIPVLIELIELTKSRH